MKKFLFSWAFLELLSYPGCIFLLPPSHYRHLISSISAANPDPKVRSSGRLHNAALYRSAIPDLRIMILHFSIFLHLS
jgi:hypothetical protein